MDLNVLADRELERAYRAQYTGKLFQEIGYQREADQYLDECEAHIDRATRLYKLIDEVAHVFTD